MSANIETVSEARALARQAYQRSRHPKRTARADRVRSPIVSSYPPVFHIGIPAGITTCGNMYNKDRR